jgi:cob(I)alamin adenosyltransferase
MSIVTRTGDDGTTGLMYGRRVSKCHPRVEACGAVDELNAALGAARASTRRPSVGEQVLQIQKDLVGLMGELATLEEDLPRYQNEGYALITNEKIAGLEAVVQHLESGMSSPHDWAMPGSTVAGAAFDLARTACRRAERCVCSLRETGQFQNPAVIVYLNRLSDLLWLLARQEDET